MQWTRTRRETLARGLESIGPELLRLPGRTALYVARRQRNHSHWYLGGGAVSLHEEGFRYQIDARLGGVDACVPWLCVTAASQGSLLAFEFPIVRGQSATVFLAPAASTGVNTEPITVMLAHVLTSRFSIGDTVGVNNLGLWALTYA